MCLLDNFFKKHVDLNLKGVIINTYRATTLLNVKKDYIMNIIKSVIARIEEYRKENKTPCKSYATQAAAEKAAEKYAKIITNAFTDDMKYEPQYFVAYNEAWGRWIVAYDIKPLLNKFGGYMGVASNLGFYTY